MKAYQLIEKPENWTKGALMRNADGVAVHNPQLAISYCVVGAIDKVYSDDIDASWDVWQSARQKLAASVGDNMGDWNDAPERTHAEVYEKLKSLDI